MAILKEDLTGIGMTDHEANIYRFLLVNPLQDILSVANTFGFSRVWALNILDEMKKKNLIETLKEGKKVLYRTTDVVALKNFAETQKDILLQQLENNKKKTDALINNIALEFSDNDEFVVEIGKGEEFLDKVREKFMYENDVKIYQIVNRNKFKLNKEEVKAKRSKIKIRKVETLYVDDKKDYIDQYSVGYLPSEVFNNIDINLTVFGKYVMFSTLKKEQKNHIIINNKHLAESMRAIFEGLKKYAAK